MKVFTILFSIICSFSIWANHPTSPKYSRLDSEHVKEIMTAWSVEKGEYLYESMAAIVMLDNQPIRPEKVTQTPFELLQTMDKSRIDRIKSVVCSELENEKNATQRNQNTYYWQEWLNYLESAFCDMSFGMSVGEPHIKTYDGENYDFQNAGDYLLSASENNSFEIQTQLFRRYANDAWSLNSGIIASVNGDIVEFRVSEKSKIGDVFINNHQVDMNENTIPLPQGGTVNYNAKLTKQMGHASPRYTVKWPTGEKMEVTMISNSSFGDNVENQDKFQLYQIYVYVPKCNSNYRGLLGNNNGVKDDLIVEKLPEDDTLYVDRSSYSYDELFGSARKSDEVKNRQTKGAYYIAHDFGDSHQLFTHTSLFPNQMTTIPDSVRYPSNVMTLEGLSDQQIADGLEKAKAAGVSEEDLYGAVFDYGYVGINPMPHNRTDNKSESLNKRKEQVNMPQEKESINEKTKSNSSRIRVKPGIHIGVGTTTPQPTRRRPGSSDKIKTRPSSNSNSNGTRTPTGTTVPTRTPNTGGR